MVDIQAMALLAILFERQNLNVITGLAQAYGILYALVLDIDPFPAISLYYRRLAKQIASTRNNNVMKMRAESENLVWA